MAQNLERFLTAQARVHDSALAEIVAGRKTGHWMWFVFPQVAGLGHSDMARTYAIGSLAEARAYLDHPILGDRLRACVRAIPDLPVEQVFGTVDAMKLRSSLTLFDQAGGTGEPFAGALLRLFGGRADAATLRFVGEAG